MGFEDLTEEERTHLSMLMLGECEDATDDGGLDGPILGLAHEGDV